MKLYNNPRKPINIDLEELKRLRAQGYTRRQLAEHFGVTPLTITNRLKREGLTFEDITPENVSESTWSRKRKDIDLEELKRLRAQGYTQSQLAEHFGVNHATIARRLKNEGLGFRSDLQDIELEDVKRLRAQGYTITQLAKHFGVSTTTITRRLEREGLTLKEITPESVRIPRGISFKDIHDIDIEEVKRLRAQGCTITEIAEHFGVNPATITNRLRREGLTLEDITPESVNIVRGGSSPIYDIDIEELKRLRAQGYTIHQLAEHFGVNPTTITNRLRREGLTLKDITPESVRIPRGISFKDKIDIEEVKRLRAQGFTKAQLAEHFGVALSTLTNWLRREGLTLGDITPESVSIRPGRQTQDIDIEEVKRLRAQGYTLARLAEHFGVSHPTITNQLKREGLTLKDITPKGNPLQMQGSTINKTVGFGVGVAATTALDYTLNKTTDISSTKRHLISGGTTTAVGLGVYATTKREDALWSAYGSLFATVGCLIYDKINGK